MAESLSSKSEPAPDPMTSWLERCRTQHEEAVRAGLHDDRCEYDIDSGFMLCHCSKRRREAAGHTTPPGPLVFVEPYCPRCDAHVYHDGDSFVCERCCCHWDRHGEEAEFTDEYGNLDPCAEHAKRGCGRCR